MTVLGISASSRPRGNTDTLVRRALQGAEAQGAETSFVRLGDYELEPCHGCMACVFKGEECRIKDRFPAFLDELRWADAVVLGSPAYVLGATGVVKNLQDRLIRYGMTREFTGRLGVAVVAAGVRGWTPFSLSQVALMFLFLGMPVVDQFIGYAQGPGEIVFDEGALARAFRAGAALGRGDGRYLGDEGSCPICHFDLISVGEPDGPRCVLCDLPGELRDGGGGLRLEPRPGAEPRLGSALTGHHFRENVLPSGPRFKARLRETRRKLRELGLGGEK